MIDRKMIKNNLFGLNDWVPFASLRLVRKMLNGLCICVVFFASLQCAKGGGTTGESQAALVPCVIPGKTLPCHNKTNDWTLDLTTLISPEMSSPVGIALGSGTSFLATQYGIETHDGAGHSLVYANANAVAIDANNIYSILDEGATGRPLGPLGLAWKSTSALVALNGQGGARNQVLHLNVVDGSANRGSITEVEKITVGSGPVGVAMNQNANRALITNNGNYTASPPVVGTTITAMSFDAASSRRWVVTQTITAGNGPFSVAMNRAGTRALVTLVGNTTLSSGRTDVPNGTPVFDGNTVLPLEYSDDTHTWTAGSPLTVGTGPVSVAMNNEGDRALVSNAWDKNNNITALTYSGGTWTAVGLGSTVAERDAGSGNTGVTMDGSGRRALVGHANDTFTVLDFEENRWVNRGYQFIENKCNQLRSLSMNEAGTLAVGVCVTVDKKGVYFNVTRNP